MWASGNGGNSLDDCNCDGYASSIYTLTIGSASPTGFRPSYDENCPSTMAVVYTGDAGAGKREPYSHLVTTSLFHECVTHFSGTSCAAPLAAGIFALVLEANPELTWRDMQHLVVQTAEKNDPKGASWSKVRFYDILPVELSDGPQARNRKRALLYIFFSLLCFVLFCFALLCFDLIRFDSICFLFCFVLFCFVLLRFALLCFALLCFALFCFVLFRFPFLCYALFLSVLWLS